MIFKSILVPTVVVPLGIALSVLLADAFVLRRNRPAESAGSIAGLAVALAFLGGFVAMTGWPRWPPVQSTHRLFFAVVAAAALGLLLTRFGGSQERPARSRGVRMVVAGILFATMLRFLLHAPIENSWTGSQAALWLAGLTAVGLLLLWALERSLAGAPNDSPDWSFGSLFPTALFLTLLGLTSATMGVSETARLAQLLGAAACGVGAAELISRISGNRAPTWQPADALAMTTILLGLLVCAHFYAELSLLAFGLIVGSFLVLGVFAGFDKRWLQVLAIVPLLIALTMTGYAYMNQPENPYLDYYPADE
jgi:hypothetical protein